MELISNEERVVVFGGKGMVGSAIKRSLLRKGYSNLITASKKDLDLSDYESVKKWFKFHKPQIVILAAAKVGGIQANFKFPSEFILENLKIQTNVIEIARENNVKRFLFLGSFARSLLKKKVY